jgi:UDP-GlcNAc:undecaprenyl-phosphate GlcNAc-1-phosphate transferase
MALMALSGSVSLVSLALDLPWLPITAVASNAHVFFIIALMGGVGGFLYYNLRYPGNRRARVFLGDNGSMLLGFLFAWLFIVPCHRRRAGRR